MNDKFFFFNFWKYILWSNLIICSSESWWSKRVALTVQKREQVVGLHSSPTAPLQHHDGRCASFEGRDHHREWRPVLVWLTTLREAKAREVLVCVVLGLSTYSTCAWSRVPPLHLRGLVCLPTTLPSGRISLLSLHAAPHHLFVLDVSSWLSNSRPAQHLGCSGAPTTCTPLLQNFWKALPIAFLEPIHHAEVGAATFFESTRTTSTLSRVTSPCAGRAAMHSSNATLSAAVKAPFKKVRTVRMTIARRRKISCKSRLSRLAMPTATARAQTCTSWTPSTSTPMPAAEPATEPPSAAKLTVMELSDSGIVPPASPAELIARSRWRSSNRLGGGELGLSNAVAWTSRSKSAWVGRTDGGCRKGESNGGGASKPEESPCVRSNSKASHTSSVGIAPGWCFEMRSASRALQPSLTTWSPPRCHCSWRVHHCAPTVHNRCRPGWSGTASCPWRKGPRSWQIAAESIGSWVCGLANSASTIPTQADGAPGTHHGTVPPVISASLSAA